jgi:nicotinamidase-related amidase
MNRHEKIFQRENSALLVIDIQEKILPVIFEFERVIENSLKLINGFKILNVPIYFTEQYPKGLGPTESRVKAALNGLTLYEKMSFSCIGAEGLFEKFKNQNIKKVVLCGIESHVCVFQSSLDLIANGFQVYIAADAVSSRRKFDYEIALERMRKHGVEISLTESILFEMLNVCGTDEFKAVSKLVK